MATTNGPRKWLAGCGKAPTSQEVRDDDGNIWRRGKDDKYHDHSNRHHYTPSELHNRTDLVEVQ